MPQQPQDDVLPALRQDVGVHVDDVAADGGGGVDGQGQVLVPLEEGELGALVDHAGVDGVGDGEVDQFAEEGEVS